MSIIHDALKKIESNIGQNQPPPDGAPPRQNQPRKSTLMPFVKYLLIAVIIMLAAYLFAGARITVYGRRITAMLSGTKEKGETPVINLQSVASYRKKKNTLRGGESQNGGWTLNGIFFSGNEGYALINNQIVKAGEEIDGALLREIDKDEVKIEINGSIRVLTLRRMPRP